MVKLIEKGVYFKDGKLIRAKTPDLTAKKGTMAYKILSAHNHSGDDKKLNIKFDEITSHDITYVGIIQTAKASGLEKFPIPYTLTNCHNSLCAVGGTINEDVTFSAYLQLKSMAVRSCHHTLRLFTNICVKCALIAVQ